MYKYLRLYVAGIIEISVSKILENSKETKNGEIRRHFKDPVNSFMMSSLSYRNQPIGLHNNIYMTGTFVMKEFNLI